ncbi:hypothetical protein NFF69_14100 [Proteus mirabilis]|uniref:tail fiber/spike domain-containing protein n=1 Tax=Proteus mirabilis TaxID=584 RepID=UPI0023F6F9E4|nr:hypothetical protein [Proteus mirabilis]MDF7245185.1 hypothetical protein [Proteus mirabilis]MDF7317866.1 hypothetical protein [Proteus mirabilis]
MSTIPTQNPVPSEAAKDLKFNSGKIDEFVTSMKNKYIDRFGQEHFTIEGLRWIAQQAISQFGYITLDSFQKGAEITLPNQVLRDEVTGEYYRWDGALPKVVPIDSTPDSSGGIGVNAWLSIGDASLRRLLESTDGADTVGTKYGSTVQDELDALNNKYIFEMPTYFKKAYSEPIDGEDYPQGLAESDNYWFIIYTDRSTSPQKSHIKRIDKATGESTDSGDIQYGDLHNIAVLNDNEVIYVTPVSTGSYSYSDSLTKYNFTTGSSSAMSFIDDVKMSTTYGFCYDGHDKLYQIDRFNQQPNQDGRFEQIRVYSISNMTLIAIIPMPREPVREGFIQAIDYHQGILYFYTGGAYLGTETSNKAVTSIYAASLNGQILSGAQYSALSFASRFKEDGSSGYKYEAQGLSALNGRIKVLCYINGFANILESSDKLSGVSVRQGIGGSSYIRALTYSSFSDLNVSNADLLSSGDAIGTLANRMLDNSILECALDRTSWGAITSQLGISSGNIRIYRANANRISGEVIQSNSDGIPYVTNFSVYSGVTSILLRNLSTRTKSELLYTGALIANVGDVVNFDNHTYTSISIACTNSSPSNPCAITTYNHGNINFLIDNNVSLAISNGNSILQFVFTSTGIRVVGTSGSPIIRYITAE